MMMQRKPLAKRAFVGLAGRPHDPDDAVVVPAPSPIAAPEPVVSEKPKRGRPPKGDHAMSNKERTQKSRARARQVETAPEREKLIRRIVRRIKTCEHAKPAVMLRALETFHDALDVLTLEDLTDIAKHYAIHDMKGRTSLEGHTGTKMNGDEFVARLERIEAKQKTKELYGGQKPVMGAAPDSSEPMEDDGSVSSSRAPIKSGEVTVWDLMPEITEFMFDGDESDIWNTDESMLTHLPTLRCRACGRLLTRWTAARRHVEEMVKGGEQLVERIKVLEDAVDNSPGYEQMLADTRRRYRDEYWSHHRAAGNFVTKRVDK
jgi:hypothetical protein